MVTGSPRPGTRCSRPPASPARPTTRWSRCSSRWTRASCGTAPTSSPGCSPTGGSPTTSPGEERPFPLDLIPRVIDALEWDLVSRGVRQRVKALEAFLEDVYGQGRAFDDGVVPWSLVFTSEKFRREVAGITPPNGVRVHVAGIDLIRDEQGKFRVLEDNVRVPSGVSYVIENRLAMTRTFPALFADQRIHHVEEYPLKLLNALRAAAPHGVVDPFVVVLTPGVHNAAYFEHTLLARLMGVELVEGRDLFCWRNRVYVHTTHGRRPVDVIYRRVDDDWLDPLHFRPDSVLGCPGLLNAVRHGTVTVANGVGNGVADDKLIYTYMPDLIRYYLAEEPILENVESYRLDDPDVLDWVLSNAETLVLKPVDGAGGAGIVIGPAATGEEIAAVKAKVKANPRGWMAQRPVALSTSPVLIGEKLSPRHIDLRPFAVNDGNDVWVLPGRPDARRAAGGRAQGELQPGRRLQGHLGARRHGPFGRRALRAASEPARAARPPPPADRSWPSSPGRAGPSSEQRAAQPHRGDALLDRPVRRAGRRHRPADRRVRAPDAGRDRGRLRRRLPRAVRHPRRAGRARRRAA